MDIQEKHDNFPVDGILIYCRHLLQTLVRVLLKFVSTVSMKILFYLHCLSKGSTL